MIFIVIVISVFSLDQLSKFLVIKNLALGESFPVIKGILHLSLVNNRGAAFGMLQNSIPLIIAASLVALTLIYTELKNNSRNRNRVYNVSLCLILGGALGNLFDRLFLGYVVDFIDLRVWPVFNLADSAITVGVVLLGLSILKKGKKGVNVS